MKRSFNKYGAKKTPCANGHTHDSAREAKRCNELHLLQAAHQIGFLRIQPRFEFTIAGKPLKMKNGHTARFTPDFAYVELPSLKEVAEDSKGFVVRDYPLRAALFRALYPMTELREV